MEKKYGTYLEKVCSVMRKKFIFAEQRETELEETIKEEIKVLHHMEAEALSEGEFWPLAYLCNLQTWSSFAYHVLYLLFFQKVCSDASRACSRLNESEQKNYITWQTAVKTFERPISDSDSALLFSEYSLFFKMFLKKTEREDELCLDDRIFYLITSRVPEYPGYNGWIEYFYSSQEQMYASDQKLLRSIGRLAKSDSDQKCVCQIYGSAGTGKKTFLGNLSQMLQREIVLLYPKEIHVREESDIWWRECFLWDAIPAIMVEKDVNWQDKQIEEKLEKILRQNTFVLMLAEEKIDISLQNGVVLSFPMEEYLSEKSDTAWERLAVEYPLKQDVILEELKGKFNLSVGQITRAYAMADRYREMKKEAMISSEMLHEACCELLSTTWEGKAQRMECAWTWEDIVLPEEQKKRLQTACSQVKYRNKVYSEWGFEKMVPYGKGISILLSGPPGTGKTMAAQVVAADLQMELYRICIPSVVSKYVGETEKNLEEIFKRAKKSQVILFFDEADVLFSKRIEVKDSNDKYNNMEAAFLLQKMEEYDGVTLLATNYLKNFDEAFKRRIKFIVDFPFPDVKSREKIWRKLIPDFMGPLQIDFTYLSERFELSGSNIKNIVLYAVFLVAESGEILGMQHILEGIRNEYDKLGKALTAEELAEYAMLLE